MTAPLTHLVIIGGGAAGWLTAGILAAEHKAASAGGLKITLIESPDVATVGVGEGSWPTLRDTLAKIGISETEFIREADASFKQGTRFVGWRSDEGADRYYHPFMLPQGYGRANLVPYWQAHRHAPFAETVSFQPHLCAADRAPKQKSTPEYAAVANYGYHLDAAKFAKLLTRHCTQQLGVRHIADHVTGVVAADRDIAAVTTRQHGEIAGDLFIDCSGLAALLIGKHYQTPWIDRRGVLFNDRAISGPMPYASDRAPIASQTIATARDCGWIWDIALPTRRGVGHVYSSAYLSDDRAEAALRAYVAAEAGADAAAAIAIRKHSFCPGHREVFWRQNCVAIGMAAGFIEPLEASALVMIELAATMIADDLPANRAGMDIAARRFNQRFRYRWDRIVDFLKLHYVLSGRQASAYWRDNRDPATIPPDLLELLALWADQPPSSHDLWQKDEVFPSASYQYVLYGMGFHTADRPTARLRDDCQTAERLIAETQGMAHKFLGGLPSNRDLIDHIHAHGLPRAWKPT